MNTYIPSKDLLEEISLALSNILGELKHCVDVTFRLPKEEHLKLDKLLFENFGDGDFIHREIINLNIEGVNLKFIIDNNLIVDKSIKEDEYGNKYI